MIALLICLAVFFVSLGAVGLLDALGGNHDGPRVGAALFALVFLAVSIGCFSFAIGRVVAHAGRRRCPSCGARIRRRSSLCRHCYRAVAVEDEGRP